MAIDATRGLPSFSEMYSAFKNRGSLGDAINAGFGAYNEGKAAVSKENLQGAQAEEARATAKAKGVQKEATIRLDQITDPQERQALQSAAKPDENGILMVPISSYNAISKTAQNQALNELKSVQQAEQAKHNADIAAKDAKIAELLANRIESTATTGANAQEITATKGALTSLGAPEDITLGEKLQRKVGQAVSTVAPNVGKAIIPSVFAREEERNALREQLKGKPKQKAPTNGPMSAAQGKVVDQAVGIQPTSPDVMKAQDILRKAGKPVTDANVAEVLRRMGK